MCLNFIFIDATNKKKNKNIKLDIFIYLKNKEDK